MSEVVDGQINAAEQRWRAAWLTGPTRLRWTAMPIQIGDSAPDGTLPDHRGQPTKLSELWRDAPLLLLFWRHFGCSCGMDRATRLNEELGLYQAAGAAIAIVGQGEPERAAVYRAEQSLSVPILSDPSRSLYEAYGLLQGSPAQILFDAPDSMLRVEDQAGADLAASRRGTNRAPVDDPWQLPGEFVIDSRGVIRHVHRYGWCEDYPDPRVHVAAIRQAAGAL